MDENEMTTGGEEQQAEDVLAEDFAEEPQDDSESLDDVMDEAGGQQEEPQGTGGQSEPGWFRKRWEKEVGKLTAQIRDEMRNEYESQMAPMREYMLNQEAQELVRSGKVKDLETAKELVRYRQGQPQPEKQEQTRNERGQFAANPQQEQRRDPVMQKRIDMLQHQAERLKKRGIDVIEEFRNNEQVKRKVAVTEEWDFEDVAEYMASRQKKTPAPMRSPNGASGANRTAIENMTDEQFDRLVKNVQGGKRYSQK